MKKRIVMLLLTAAVLFLSSAPVSAAEPQIEPGEFTLATFHTVNYLLSSDDGIDALAVSSDWVAQNKDRLNIKLAGFVGSLTNSSRTDYSKYIAEGHTFNEFVAHTQTEPAWLAEWEAVAGATSAIREAGIPLAFTLGKRDYPAAGISRPTPMAEVLPLSVILPQEAVFLAYDEANYYVMAHQDDYQYMLLTLELWPRKSVLKWAEEQIGKHPNARVVLLTSSFMDEQGEMYTMWDWNLFVGMTAAEFISRYMSLPEYTTQIKSCNLAWTDFPRDGDGIWKEFITKNDNIFMVITGNGSGMANSDGVSITKQVMKNQAGHDVLILFADTKNAYGKYGLTHMLTKIGENGTTVHFELYSMWDGVLEDTKGSATLALKEVSRQAQAEKKPQIRQQILGQHTAYMNGYGDNEFRPQSNMTRAEACTIIARLLDTAESFRGQYAAGIADVQEDKWYYDYIAYLDHFAFLDRYGDSFLPDSNITRAEFVELAYLAGGFAAGAKTVRFTDVPPSHPFYDAILAAARSGLVNGYEDATFRPDATITRAEVAAIVNRVLNITPEAKDLENASFNEFGDIGGHWAYNDILVASNSNLMSENYKTIDLTGIYEENGSIILENRYLKYVISQTGAKVTGVIDVATGTDIKNNLTSPQFCYLYEESGTKVMPSGVRLENNKLAVTFNDGSKLYFIAQVRDTYLTFELDSSVSSKYKGIVFAQTPLKYDLADDNAFCAIGYAMTYWTDMSYYPSAVSMAVKADARTKFRTRGAKLAIIAAPKSEHREIMKLVNREMVKGDALVSSIGGPNAFDHAENYGDYVIISESAAENVPYWTELCQTYGIDQLDFHKGDATFLNGSFTFTKYPGAAAFREQVADPLRAAGVLSGLHTYAQYIDPKDTALLSVPYWQRQVGVLETFTLRSDIGKFATQLFTVENTSSVSLDTAFFTRNSVYILIDEEIMRFTAVGANNLIVNRAQCGTKAAVHEAGAVIRHLDGCFNMLMPDPDSELFLEVARNTAKAYNEGGFSMIYLDAIDGMGRHVPADEVWYYDARFVSEILKHCQTDPILEYSSMYPSLWPSRTRMGAWDHAKMGYKDFIALHVRSNLSYTASYLPTTLGWYSLYPLDAYEGNANVKYQYFDDVDYIGSMCLAYDMGMVHQSTETIGTVPAYKRNILHYHQYAVLRKTNYFSESVKKQIREGKYEYAVTQKADGSWAFYEKFYDKAKLYEIGAAGRTELNGENPFGAQQPFIRIEGHYSASAKEGIPLLTLDSAKALRDQKTEASFSSELNIKDSRALAVRVYGNNSGDAIVIRLTCNSAGDPAVADYLIRLDFEGWREFILAERDNGSFGDLVFDGKTDSQYEFYRGSFQYDRVTGVKLYYSGKCAGVMMSSIEAVPYLENAIRNPSVTVSGKTVTFRTEIGGSEYLEYFPGDLSAKVYNRIGEYRQAALDGEIPTVSGGRFTATLAGEKSADAPLRATLTFGFTGKELT